jgi:hypothetical protein
MRKAGKGERMRALSFRGFVPHETPCGHRWRLRGYPATMRRAG